MRPITELLAHLGAWNWFILAVVLFALETVVPGVHFLWFGIAAAIVGLLGLATGFAWQWQLIAFALVAIATVFFARRWARPDTVASDLPDLNVRGAQYIGRRVVVAEAIVNGRGKVKVGDTVWSAAGARTRPPATASRWSGSTARCSWSRGWSASDGGRGRPSWPSWPSWPSCRMLRAERARSARTRWQESLNHLTTAASEQGTRGGHGTLSGSGEPKGRGRQIDRRRHARPRRRRVGRRRVLVMDLDTQCNASLMLVGGEGWDRARRSGRTIADYFYDRFDKVAEDESHYVLPRIGDVAHPPHGRGHVSLLAGSLLLEDIQGELYLGQAKRGVELDKASTGVRTRMRTMMRHFAHDFDLVILDCPPGLSLAGLAALDLADRVLVPFRADLVSQFALDRVALLIERRDTAEALEEVPFEQRRYVCLPNYLRGHPRERLLLDQFAVEHPLLAARLPMLDSIADAFDWDEQRKSMEQKYGAAMPYLRALHDEVMAAPTLAVEPD